MLADYLWAPLSPSPRCRWTRRTPARPVISACGSYRDQLTRLSPDPSLNVSDGFPPAQLAVTHPALR